MRVLNLDLDFFLDEIAYFRADDSRLDSNQYKPWAESKVFCFLENNCGLSMNSTVKGRVVKHHDEAFDYWRELVYSGKLSTPFDVLHIDSHNDLGLGDSGYTYLMSEFLHISPNCRPLKIDRSQVNFSNYLAFAVACRWISRIYWICHPNKSYGLLSYHFKNYDKNSGTVQLKKLAKNSFKDSGNINCVTSLPILELEPEVPFQILPWSKFYTKKPCDYIVLSQSPGFTPSDSDNLIPVISRYINQT
ncbi:UPF0489 family protein [Chloroflexota bacterium]